MVDEVVARIEAVATPATRDTTDGNVTAAQLTQPDKLAEAEARVRAAAPGTGTALPPAELAEVIATMVERMEALAVTTATILMSQPDDRLEDDA